MPYNTELDQVFGEAIEAVEQQARQELLQLHTLFYIYDNMEESEKKKDWIIYNLIVVSGVIDPETDTLLK